ncbi:MAG: porin [Alphaproteobacteria bacterium]|nr:porin [Alphaproteobacteria bacterium]
MILPVLTTTVSTVALILSGSNAVAQSLPSRAEMWQIIQKQQQQIKKLEAVVGLTTRKIVENEKKIEATGDALEQVSGVSGHGSPVNSAATSIGGYSELHYNGGRKDQVDLHRFVVFLSHEFNQKIRFFSELEVEHNTVEAGAVGAVEVEQAFVEMDLNDNNKLSVGLQLIPVGIINETHEPPTFYGVERNNVEKNIIPTTWWEAGVKMSGNLNQSFSYDLMIHSGLDTTGSGYKIRKGRRNVSEAPWKNSAVSARLSWHGIPGVKIAATFQYQSDITQSSRADENAAATLFEIHTDSRRAVGKRGTIALRALFAQWNIRGTMARLTGRNIQRGWYIEPSYRIAIDDEQAIGFFTRYSLWDTEAGDIVASANRRTSFGVNYWPHENVVLKLDYQIDNFAKSATGDNRINLGLGLQF